MTSNKKFITILLFVGALALNFFAIIVGIRLSTVTQLEAMILLSQQITMLNFFAGMVTLSVIAVLISDMN